MWMRADAIVVGRGPVCEEKRRRGEREECNELTIVDDDGTNHSITECVTLRK